MSELAIEHIEQNFAEIHPLMTAAEALAEAKLRQRMRLEWSGRPRGDDGPQMLDGGVGLMQGVELVNRLVLGEPETTIGMTYRITEDGRHAALHERSAAAGSGEKRIPAPAAPQIVVRTNVVGDRAEADVAEEELGVTQQRE